MWIRIVECGTGNHGGPGLSERARAWVQAQIGENAAVIAVRPLHDGESPRWIDLRFADGSASAVVLRTPSWRISAGMVATNAAALVVAERHGISTPRLLGADLDGRHAGLPATLETVIRGAGTWPVAGSTSLLRAAGAAIAQVHHIVITSQPHLPLRPRPIAVDDFAQERRLGRMPTTALLQVADERVQAYRAPDLPIVFVHGDVWPGNMMIMGAKVRALIDWKTAGVGNPGVDLGELRKQVAISFGEKAPIYVLEGWERASGVRAENVPYWDATAALNTPTESDSPTAARRRDAFLRAAIAQL
jgi:aminoglycoside phosphotransferase (APT) family kinase protein